MKSAYVIGNITVLDQTRWSEYRSKVPATLTPWGGELVFRGKRSKAFCGEYDHTDIVVIRFPNAQALNNWFDSDAYQALISIREQAAKMDLISYETEG